LALTLAIVDELVFPRPGADGLSPSAALLQIQTENIVSFELLSAVKSLMEEKCA
jgi:hypothetical protein